MLDDYKYTIEEREVNNWLALFWPRLCFYIVLLLISLGIIF